MATLVKQQVFDPLPTHMGVDERFLQSGEQTRITSGIKDFADRFPGKGVEDVRAVMTEIARFKREKCNKNSIRNKYSQRTASEIIEDRKVYVADKADSKHASIQGCIDYNVALCAVLRAKGIPAKFTRAEDHATTHFKVDGMWYIADVLAKVTNRVKTDKEPETLPITQEKLEDIEYLKGRGKYAEGLDAWDIGIKSLQDYHKYM